MSVNTFYNIKRVLFLLVCSTCFLCNSYGLYNEERVEFLDSTIYELIDCYQFEKALQNLDEEIKAQTRLKQDVSKLLQEKERLSRCAQMLSVTEDVCFIDSMILSKTDMFSKLPLSSEIGKVGQLKDVNPLIADKYDSIKYLASYMNSINDRIYLTMKDSDSVNKLYVSNRLLNEWTPPAPLSGITNIEGSQSYPYMCADGVTFYYSSCSTLGIGGSDIYVTRYVVDEDRFLKPELLGMPFNSPANDYFYIYDEDKGVGCFATDRRQAEDSVCVYFFLPNSARHTIEVDSLGNDSVVGYAQIRSIKDTWKDVGLVNQWKTILHKKDSESVDSRCRYIIKNDLIYTSIEDFVSLSARDYARQWTEALEALDTMKKDLERMRKAYIHGNSEVVLRQKILKSEKEIASLIIKVNDLEKRMRMEELIVISQ